MQTRAGSKGIKGRLTRTILLPMRYGITADRLRARLDQMINSLCHVDVTPTINVTASALVAAPEVADDLRGVDLGIHGYSHMNYASHPLETRAADLDKAMRAMARSGLSARGFRAPYLALDDSTLALLEARGFDFDSSVPSVCLESDSTLMEPILHLSQLRYPSLRHQPVLPYRAGNLVEIPVSIPDDEILVDGLGITNASTLERVFLSMLNRTIDEGSLMVMQIHPERYEYCADAIRQVVLQARSAGGWMTCLSEVATWCGAQNSQTSAWPKGRNFAVAVTGDLDALRLGDFASRLWSIPK